MSWCCCCFSNRWTKLQQIYSSPFFAESNLATIDSLLQLTSPDSWKHYPKLVLVCTAHFFSDRFSLKMIFKRTSDWILVPFFVFTGTESTLCWTNFKTTTWLQLSSTNFLIRGPFRCVWRLGLKDFGLMVSIWGQGKDVGFSWHGQSSPRRVVSMVHAR